MARFITFASGKGGVGKTTLSTNVAAAIHKQGRDVIVVDGNLSTPNVSIMLGMPKLPVTLHDVLAGKASPKSAVYLHESGLKVMPGGLGMKNMKRTQKKNLAHALNEFIGSTEFVIIDCAAGLGQEAIQAMHAGDEMVLVTNPEIHALTDALKAFEYAKEVGIRPLGVILNRVAGKDWEMTKENVEEFLELPVIGIVPEDMHVKKAIAYKKPVIFSYPDSPSAKAIMRISSRLIGSEYKENKSVFDKILMFFGIGKQY